MTHIGTELGDAHSIKRKSSNKLSFTPLALAPTIFYDLADFEYTKVYTNSSILHNYASAEKLINKANPATYDAVQGASAEKLLLNCSQLNNNISLGNRGNHYLQTNYSPKSGAFTFAINVKLPTTLSARSMFGCNDNANHRMLAQFETSGAITFGIGGSSFTTTALYSANQVLSIIATGTGSVFNAWINGVQVITNQAYTFTGTSTNSMLLHGRTFAGTPTGFWNTGFIGDFVYLEREITAAERAKLQTFMTARTVDSVKIKVLIVAGQSNSTGINTDADYTTSDKEKPNPRIWQIAGTAVVNENDIIPAYEPLKHRSQSTNAVAIGFAAAKAYLATQSDPNIRVLIVPAGQGNTGYSTGEWVRTTGSLYTNLVAKANLAIASGADTELLWMAWQQGEREVGALTKAQYEAYYTDMLAGFRSEITGATNMKVTAGEMVPDFNGGVIRTAIQGINSVDALSAYVSSAGLTDMGDDLHFDGASSRIMGQRHYAGYTGIM